MWRQSRLLDRIMTRHDHVDVYMIVSHLIDILTRHCVFLVDSDQSLRPEEVRGWVAREARARRAESDWAFSFEAIASDDHQVIAE